jgi:WD40 repeat protein
MGVALLVGVALSPAGASVRRFITRALGVQHAAPVLFSLPARGDLLVSGRGGTWTVAADGSTRRVGRWTGASWSPHGLYLIVVGADRLAAISPRGVPKWTLGRSRVADPSWFAPTGYRVAYLSGHDLRVVAGDGTGDHLLATGVARVAPTWRPGHPYQLAYLTTAGRLVVRDGDSGLIAWSVKSPVNARQLTWSDDGQRLLVLSPQKALLYDADGRLVRKLTAFRSAPLVGGALSSNGRELALVSGGPSGEVTVTDPEAPHPVARRVLAGSGLGQVDFSPDGRWLVITWPAANQWVFVRVVGAPRITAVSRIAQQFSSGATTAFPRLEGWCCTAAGTAG